jgi:hypothetical protein
MIELEHAFDYEARLEPPLPIGAGPYGTRVFFQAKGGEVRGPMLTGRALSGGGDWALVGDDGFARVDVRAQVETDDGALLYVTYQGVIELNQAMREAMRSGGETDFGDQYFRISPRIETGDERYRRLTQSTFVGRGRACAGPGVAYQVFRVA